jgi:hypothetical protein
MRADQGNDGILRQQLGDGIGRGGRVHTLIIGKHKVDRMALHATARIYLLGRRGDAVLHPLAELRELRGQRRGHADLDGRAVGAGRHWRGGHGQSGGGRKAPQEPAP